MNGLLSLLLGCCLLAGNPPEQGPQQGIQGKVVLRTGNHMPGPRNRVPPPTQAAVREIRVYALTHISQVQTRGSFFSAIQTKLVAKVVSGQDGTFQVLVPPGHYSLLSREPDGLFANRIDGKNYIFPVEVKTGQMTPVEFMIDYNASY